MDKAVSGLQGQMAEGLTESGGFMGVSRRGVDGKPV